MKKTPWFPASVNPVHEGVYQTRWRYWTGPKLVNLFWRGDTWLYPTGIPCKAFGAKSDKWRGLTEKA